MNIINNIKGKVTDKLEKKRLFKNDDIAGLVINYKTLKHIKNCVTSFRKFYPNMHLLIIDNSRYDSSSEWIYTFAKKDKNISVILNTYNMHHGPSMHKGIVYLKDLFDNVLIFDSDIIFYKKDIILDMKKKINDNKYLCQGVMVWVDENGINVEGKLGIPYIHPLCMLLNIEEYLNYKPFKKHGAPCIDTMKDIQDKNKEILLKEFPVFDYLKHIGRGTVNKTGGYHL